MKLTSLPQKRGPAWAPLVPAGWCVVPLFAVGRESRTKNTGLAEQNLLSLSYGRIIRKDINASEGLLPESFETYQIVQPDDIVFRFTDLQNDQRSLRSARVLERGIVTSAYMAFTPRRVSARFFAYLMRGYDVSKVFYGMGGGLRQSLKFADVRRLPVLLPPTEEQCAIADFLDRETAKIDALIEKQNALIDRLRERRLSCLNTHLEAVPGAVGTPLRKVVRIQSGVTLGKAFEQSRHLVDYPYLRVANVQTGRVQIDDVSSIELPPEVANRSLLRKGDVLITEGGDRAALARGSLWTGELDPCLHQNHLYALRPDPRALRAEYLLYVLEGSAARQYFESTRRQTTNLSATNSRLVRAFRFTLPSVAEQDSIVAALERELSQIDALIATCERFVELVRERRSALITAAVTGQIDVMGVAAA